MTQISFGSSQVQKIYYGDIPVNKIYYMNQLFYTRECTFTIMPDPSDSTVTFNTQGIISGNSITVLYGTNVSYTVSKSGYVSVSNTITITDDTTLPVSLTGQPVLTINPTPSNATVVLTAPGYTQVGNSIMVYPGTQVTYTVSKTDYATQTNTITVNNSQTLNVQLQYTPYTPGQVLFESSTPGTYTFTPLVAGTYNIICVGGGAGGAAASMPVGSTHLGYTSASGGGAGGYSNVNVIIESTITVNVGAGGNGATKTSNYHTTGNMDAYSVAGGNSYIGSYVSANGGGRAYSKPAGGTAGSGGSGTTTNGNSGTHTHNTSNKANASGGASVYGGYGAGGSSSSSHSSYSMGSSYNHKCSASASRGGDGYVKITFLNY